MSLLTAIAAMLPAPALAHSRLLTPLERELAERLALRKAARPAKRAAALQGAATRRKGARGGLWCGGGSI